MFYVDYVKWFSPRQRDPLDGLSLGRAEVLSNVNVNLGRYFSGFLVLHCLPKRILYLVCTERFVVRL